jgi:hypothetical protein
MSSDAPGPRPRQVTIGGMAVAVASAMLVVAVFDQMASLHSVDRREALTEALTTGSLKDLGISVADALSVMRVGLYVAALAAVVTGILGVFVLRRDPTARLVLTVAAVPVVLTAPFSGGILALVVGGATALLWSAPANDWFARRAPARPAQRLTGSAPTRLDRRDLPDRPAPVWPPPLGHDSAQPAPTAKWGQPTPPTLPVATRPAARAGSRVPTPVRVACLLTWALGLVTTLVYLLVAVALMVDRTGTLDLVRENPAIRDRSLSDDDLVAVLLAVAVVIVGWCLVAGVLALLVWRRRAWARVLLLVSIGAAAVVEVISLPYSLLNLAATVAAFRLLLLPSASAWFRDGSGAGSAGEPTHALGWAPPDPRFHQAPQNPAQSPAESPAPNPAQNPDAGQKPVHEPAQESVPGSGPPQEQPPGRPPVW